MSDYIQYETNQKDYQVTDTPEEKDYYVKDKLIDSADSYDNFTGLDKSMYGSVKFVMKVQADDTENDGTKSSTLNSETTKDTSANSKKTSSNFIEWIKSKFNK